jgi:hypothetical protein
MERDIDSAKFDVTDASGKVLHTITSPVCVNGYLSDNFHGDMNPGQYTITVSSPSLKASYRTIISVVVLAGTLPVTAAVTPEQELPSCRSWSRRSNSHSGI